MINVDMLKLAKKVVIDYYNEGANLITTDDVFIVWFYKTFQDWRALIGIYGSNIYYEVTFNGTTDKIYLDIYEKRKNKCIPLSTYFSYDI